jgi:hypothetical protein
VKFFLGDIADKSVYEGKLKFQGSNSNNGEGVYNDIFTVDENVHEGWNYHTWTEET